MPESGLDGLRFPESVRWHDDLVWFCNWLTYADVPNKRCVRVAEGGAVLDREIGAVFVRVADQNRSLEFFVDKLGFEKRADFVYGERHRWVEVAPPGAANTIALVPPSERPAGLTRAS